jgi:hypothetical protein
MTHEYAEIWLRFAVASVSACSHDYLDEAAAELIAKEADIMVKEYEKRFCEPTKETDE